MGAGSREENARREESKKENTKPQPPGRVAAGIFLSRAALGRAVS
jgi:hypothetical protein